MNKLKRVGPSERIRRAKRPKNLVVHLPKSEDEPENAGEIEDEGSLDYFDRYIAGDR